MQEQELETLMGLTLEALVAANAPQTPKSLALATGFGVQRIFVALKKMADAGLITPSVAGQSEAAWSIKSDIQPMDWAMAVEAGMPLAVMEKNLSLKASDRRTAERLAHDGSADAAASQQRAAAADKRARIIRGRAASMAAATDLARIVNDTQAALEPSDQDNRVRAEIRRSAEAALEALTKAMEKG